MAWRRGGGRYADPGFVRSAWFPWLFTTMQGVAYSSPLSDANVFMLIFGWGMFIYAGMVALFFLGNALWGIDDGRAAPGVSSAAPETTEVGLVHPPATEASARAEHADRPAAGECTRSGYGTELSPRPAEAGSPCCYEVRLDGAPYPGDAFTDQEHSAWADALAEEIRSACPGVGVQVGMDRGPYLVLFWIRVPESERGRGLGTRAMQHLIAAADRRGVRRSGSAPAASSVGTWTGCMCSTGAWVSSTAPGAASSTPAVRDHPLVDSTRATGPCGAAGSSAGAPTRGARRWPRWRGCAGRRGACAAAWRGVGSGWRSGRW